MKYIFVMLLFVGLSACDNKTEEVAVGNKTTMDVDLVYDAGEVIIGEMITARFNVTNTGDYPLVIAEVSASCSCTVSEHPEEPIAPGESGVIVAFLNTDKTGAGIQNKRLTVVSNTTTPFTQIVIKANVLRK